MDFKKQSRLLQVVGKDFGYDIKLTHAQEMLAKLQGFTNRHAALNSLESEKFFLIGKNILFSTLSSKKDFKPLEIANLAALQGYEGLASGYKEISAEDFKYYSLSDLFITLSDFLKGKTISKPNLFEGERSSDEEFKGTFYYFIKLSSGKLILFTSLNQYLGDDREWMIEVALKQGVLLESEIKLVQYGFATTKDKFDQLIKQNPKAVVKKEKKELKYFMLPFLAGFTTNAILFSHHCEQGQSFTSEEVIELAKKINIKDLPLISHAQEITVEKYRELLKNGCPEANK